WPLGNETKGQLNEIGHKKSRRLGGGSRKEFFPEEEAQLYAWIVEMRNVALAVTYNSLKLEMLRIVSETALKSHEPAKRWLATQKMPADLEEKLLNFQRCVIKLRRINNYPLSNIANMDETPVWFDIAGNLTVEEIGAKTVHIRTTGNENNHFIVVLICFADGQKLPHDYI
ncbi:34495_t:CDS:2, partial [Gigaspora margarita]